LIVVPLFFLEFSNNRAVTCDWTRKSTTNYDERIEMFLKDKTLFANMMRNGVNQFSFRETFWDAYMDEINQFQKIVNDYYDKGTYTIERPYECCLWVSDIVNALQRSTLSGKEEFVYPSTPVNIGFIGRGTFSKYIDTQVIQPHAWDFYNILDMYHTQNPYKNDSRLEAVYVCTPDTTHTQLIQKAMADHKHVFTEKPGFLTLRDYTAVARKAREESLRVVVNFNRRYEPFMRNVRKAVGEARGDVVLEFESADPVPHEDDPYKTIHNAVVHEIDSAVWLSWPFVEAEVTDLHCKDFKLHLSLKFLKADGRTISATISYWKQHPSYLALVTVNGQVFNNDWKDISFYNGFNRNLPGYIGAFLAFYEAVRFDMQAETDVNHPTMYWTYKLLEAALEKAKKIKK